MGNHNGCISKRRKSKNDEFIIKYIQKHKMQHNEFDSDTIHTLEQRRMIFVSLIGAYQTWKQCPPIQLYSALFILPLKRDWIYNQSTYPNEFHHHFVCTVSAVPDRDEREEFIELLKWKDSQGLVFWAMDEYEDGPQDSLTHPCWYHLNKQICNLYDPITRRTYESLNLDRKYWQNKEKFCSKYGVKRSTLLCELFFAAMKYKAIQEILYDSNPKSFVPIRYYGDECISETVISDIEHNEWFDEDDDKDEWWISPEYDPNN